MEMLNEKSLEKITEYRKQYVDYNKKDKFASSEYVLRFWEKEKQDLYKMFGNRTVIELGEVAVKADIKELENIIKEDLVIINFRDTLRSALQEYYRAHPDTRIKSYEILSLFDSEFLAINKYQGVSFDIEFNGKAIKILTGCKPTRILKKIATLLDLDAEYEEFRLAHSLDTNQRTVKGTLCLSIHPLDFMTLSDNANGWTSCMSWPNHGCYCRGTVEMMDSNCVVVGYLRDDNKKITFGIDQEEEWNSKKWRSLFIVNDKVIQAIKAYPYQNDELATRCLNALKLLAEKYYDNQYSENVYKYDGTYVDLLNDFKLKIQYSTNIMYNDFGTLNYHLGYYNISGIKNEMDKNEIYYCDYGYLDNCMCCGDDDGYFDDESQLTCEDCYYNRCANCGDAYDDSELYEVEGDLLCENCLQDLAGYDSLNEKYFYNNNLDPLYVILSAEYLNDYYKCPVAYINFPASHNFFEQLRKEDALVDIQNVYGKCVCLDKAKDLIPDELMWEWGYSSIEDLEEGVRKCVEE